MVTHHPGDHPVHQTRRQPTVRMHVMASVAPGNERGSFSLREEDVALAMPTSPPSPSRPQSRFSDNQTKASPPAPPPPPPPPPPGLPPPPPLLPGLGDPTGGLRKKKRVRSFFWKTIPEEQVKGRANVWTQGLVQQQYQIDVQTIEELFGQNDSQNAKATPSRGGKARSSFRDTKEEVSILDSKRGMNIGIFLKQFKRSNQAIVDDIRHGNGELYGAEALRELLKLLPETDEVKKLKAYRGDVSKLSLADSFVFLLIQINSYSVRIESMLLKTEFPVACEAMKRDIKILRSATKELMCCEELHAVLHLVLQAGNILNAGGYAGNAVGFKLSSLLSLADTKANKPGMNLLHFVALEAQKKDGKLLEFPLKLTHVKTAARISLETLDTDLQCLTSRTHSVEESVQRDTELLQQLDNFLQSATSSLCSLRGSRQHLKKEGSELIDFFCEDRDAFRLDDCFSIFHTFCSRFTGAVKENMEREAKEVARRRRLQDLEEQKRHSWSGGEEVGGAFGLRCSSEADMSAAMSRQDEAGLMEFLSSRSHPRSPLTNSRIPLGRSGSLRRSRKSPSRSPTINADRELSMVLGMATPDHRLTQQRGVEEERTVFQSASPEPGLRSPGLSPQAWSQNLRVPNAHHTTTTYLNYDATQTQVNAINPTNKESVKSTSDLNQQSDHNNNGNDRLSLGSSSQITPSEQTHFGLRGETATANDNAEKSSVDLDLSGQNVSCDEKTNPGASNSNMSVVLEKCTLVPELKAFDKNTHRDRLYGYSQDDMVITDLEEEGADKSNLQEVQGNSHIGNAEKKDFFFPDTSSSSSQRNEEEEREDKVVVWCVTGVCEAASERTNTDDPLEQTERNQCTSDNQGGNEKAFSAPTKHTPSEPQLANETSVPEPISSQPVPVSRCDNSPHTISSTSWQPAEQPSSSQTLTTDASKDTKEPVDQGEEAEGSANEEKQLETLPEKSTESKSNTDHTTNENPEAAPPTNGKAEAATLSKPSTKNLATSKAPPAGIKHTTPNTNKCKPVRTLTNSENQGMRRVVPISRTSRGPPPLSKHPEKPPGHQRGSSSAAASSSLNVTNFNSSSLRRGEKPSTSPSTQRSSIHKDPKDAKDRKISGTHAFPREQKQDLQRRPSIQKPLMKPKTQPEEKMCRSTLRALSQAAANGGGGGSLSAPATPLRKAITPSSSPLPGFARNTASSSFRRTLTPAAPHSAHSGSDSSPKTSSKTSSSSFVPPTGTSSPFTRAGSLRVSTTTKSSDLHKPSSSSTSSPLRRTQSIRTTPRPPLLDLQAPSKGHRRNDSGSFSDKSAHSRESGKVSKPGWR
ncbi:FH2 domain-containing protein 1-like [Scomber scombrus]|uniref:FH2 domain-containing protein 1-like n=1 Tax=Scomber scombrus TaxID=13677 RepID=UPI002DDA84C2|nr:FH2 domain-containing protein 1-like [Scomber scombrus]